MSLSDHGKVSQSLQLSNLEVGGHGSASTSGSILASGQISGTIVPTYTVTALSDADATLTAAQLLGGILSIADTAGRTLTTPTAALLKAAIPRCKVGSSIVFSIQNTGTTATVIAAGSSVTVIDTNNTSDNIAAHTTGLFALYCTLASSSPTFSLYRLG